MSDENKKTEVEEKPKKHLFAETAVSSNAQMYSAKATKYSAEEVIDLLENAQKNALQLQQVSLWLYNNNGIYNRIINNYAGMNRYDMYLYPTNINRFSKKKVTEDKLYKEYFDIATMIEKSNCKANFRNIGVNLMIQGEVFLFEVEDSSGIVLKEINSEFCKICKVINNNLYKYSINMSKLGNEQVYSMMPPKIQQLYDAHKAGTIPPEQYSENNYVIIDEKEAVCLSLTTNLSTKTVPPLCYLFPSLLRLMTEEEQEVIENRANNLKLIHMKYPIDDEGESIIDGNEIRKWFNSAKANLPNGVAINCNPLELTTHTLQRTGNVNASNRQTLTELVYNNAGVNSELFNGNHSNNQAILTGVIADEVYVYQLNRIFENYIKYKIKNKKKNALWSVRFIDNTAYNESTKITEAQNMSTVGGSRLRLMACNHYSPLEALSLLEFETENGIDELFVPLATAYTQSGNEEDNGRPSNSENPDTEKSVGENPDSVKK